MDKRSLGKTGHMSTIVSFGSAVFNKISQKETDQMMNQVLERGINHIDVAPEYGEAEIRVGKWISEYRNNFFLGCKTLLRTKREAYEELNRSLERLHTDHFDLYQLHSVDDIMELKIAFDSEGAMETIKDAKRQGLVSNIGITSHNLPLIIQALDMYDFDVIMFPFNFVFYADEAYRSEFKELMEIAQRRDIGTMVIKAIALGNWEEKYQALPMLNRPYTTWYKPFESYEDIFQALCFVLSYNITTIVSASDPKLLFKIISVAERYQLMDEEDRVSLINKGKTYKLLEFTF